MIISDYSILNVILWVNVSKAEVYVLFLFPINFSFVFEHLQTRIYAK